VGYGRSEEEGNRGMIDEATADAMASKREIKFRVYFWKMYPVKSIIRNEDGSLIVDVDGWNPIQVSGKWKMGYLMQFTGLKDKTGKEIYEGDILLFHQLVLFSKKEGEIYDDATALVVWSDGGGGFTLKLINRHLRTLDMTKGEIIGNAYENPELLRVKLPED
jgi:hypothetical protein